MVLVLVLVLVVVVVVVGVYYHTDYGGHTAAISEQQSPVSSHAPSQKHS